MPELLETFLEGARPGLRKIAFEEDDRLVREYQGYTKSDSTNLGFELLQTYAGYPPAMEVPEATEIPEVQRVPGFQKKVELRNFGLKTSFSIQEVKTRQYEELKNYVKYLVASFRYAEETKAAEIFNLGFSTKTGADGVSVFNTAHPREDGGASQSNRPAAHIPLSPNALQNELLEFHLYKSGRGNAFVSVASQRKKLIIPAKLMFIAAEILQSSQKAYTADNTKNVLPEIEILVSHYMTDQTNWFLFAEEHDYTFWRRIPFTVETEADKKNLTVWTQVYGEIATELTRWRHLRGVPPA